MIVVISHHWCKPGMVEIARQRIDRSGSAMSAAPGFLYRYRADSVDDLSKISTMTAWQNEPSFQQFRSKRPATDVNDPSTPYLNVETELLVISKIHERVSHKATPD